MSFDSIQTGLNDVERKITKSNKIVAKGNGINYKDAVKLGTKSNSIVATIKKGIKEYSSYTPTEDEAKQLLAKMTSIVDLTETELESMVANQAQFDKLKVGGLVKRNVAKNEAASKELSVVMISKTPASIKTEAEALEKRRAAAFAKATAAFEGATGGEGEAEGEDDSD